MKIARPICCGLDVHKDIIVATIGTTDTDTRITTYIQEEFSTINSDLFHLKDWLWIPVFNVLEDDLHVFLTHPKYVKAIK